MNIPTLALETVMKKWRDIFSSDTDIDAFCMAKYGKSLKVFVGIDPEQPPTEADCPYVAMFSPYKAEGLHVTESDYIVPLGYSVLNDEKTVTGNVTEYVGMYEIDELGQLLYQKIAAASVNGPISEVEFKYETMKFFPQFVGRMNPVITIRRAIGGAINY